MFNRDLILDKLNSLHHQAKNLLLRYVEEERKALSVILLYRTKNETESALLHKAP
jgi:hypothetical protein